MAIDSDTLGGEAARPRGRQASKRPAAKPPGREGGERVKATVHLSREASVRLTVHAEMMGMDRSGLVEHLINSHLRRYVISDRGGPNPAAESPAA